MNKKFISLFMVICIFVALLTGCGGQKTASTDSKPEEDGKIVVTDAVDREVTINGPVEKVVAVGSALRFYSYIGSPDKIVGIEDGETKRPIGRPYLMANESYASLPVIGSKSSLNYEKVIELKPDVIFTTGDEKADIDKMQEKTGIPTIAISYGEATIFDPEVYESLKTMGKVIGEEKRAEEVVKYMEDCKKDLNDRTKDIPDDKRPNAYIGGVSHSGSHGIESTRGNYPLFNVLNTKNVADETGKKGVLMIDKEKLLEWNPDKIFIDLGGIGLIQEHYKKEPDYYKTLSAFKNDEIYTQLPYNWYWTNIDTVMTNAYYMGKVLYPKQFEDIDPEKKADEIYKFLLDKELYSKMAENYFGGFKKITLEEIEKMNIPKKK